MELRQETEHHMKTVIFVIKESVSVKRQDGLIARVRNWPKVSGVGRITANNKSAGFRMIWIMLDAGADTDAVLKKLRQYKSVESAEVPAPRQLV
jgi:hypothetical protein